MSIFPEKTGQTTTSAAALWYPYDAEPIDAVTKWALKSSIGFSNLDPKNAEWQSKLSINHAQLGDILSAQKDLPGALTSYRISLAIREKLAKADPTNAQWQTDHASCLAKVAQTISSASGDKQEVKGLVAYGLTIIGALEKKHPLAAEAKEIRVRLEKLRGS